MRFIFTAVCIGLMIVSTGAGAGDAPGKDMSVTLPGSDGTISAPPVPTPRLVLFTDDMEYPTPGGSPTPSPFHNWTHAPIQYSLDEWEHGTPTKIGTPAPHSGQYVWVTNLAANYGSSGDGNLRSYYLRTPEFDLSAARSANLSFWHWYSFEPTCDGGGLEVSTDNGTTWTYITPTTGYSGTIGDGGLNCGQTDLEGNQGFVNSISTWTLVDVDLTPFVGSSTVSLRFHMVLDQYADSLGWYVDDLRVDIIPARIDVTGFVTPTGVSGGDTVGVYAQVSSGGQPLQGATVEPLSDVGGTFTPGTNTTNSTGWSAFLFTTPAVGTQTTATVTLNVSKASYPNGSANLTLTLYPGATLHVTVTPVLAEGYATRGLSFLVDVTDGTSAVPGASVTMGANVSGTFTPASGTSDGSGRFWTNFTGSNPAAAVTGTLYANGTLGGYNDGQGVAWVTLFPYPVVRVDAPNGGEVLTPFSTFTVRWTGSGGVGAVSAVLEYSTTGVPGPWKPVASGQPRSGSYTWTVPNDPSTNCSLRVSLTDSNGVTVNDTSDAVFEITQLPSPTVTVSVPNGGEKWVIGTTQTITWSASGGTPPYTFNVSYSTTGISGTYTSIATGLSGTSYNWNIPNTPTGNASVKVDVVDNFGMKDSDTSDAVFEIIPPPLTVQVQIPNGGESWDGGTTHAIQWTAGGGTPPLTVDIWYSTTGPTGPYMNIVQSWPNTGIYNWTVPSTPSANCFVKIEATDSAGKKVNDTSDAAFEIPPPALSVTLNAPNGGETWQVNTGHDITWTSSGGVGNIYATLEYSTDNGGTWKSIVSGIPDTGRYAWTVPNDPTTSALVKVKVNDSYNPSQQAEDTSDAVFTIEIPTPKVDVTSPDGGEVWVVGETHAITWTASGGTGTLLISLYYSTNGGGTFTPIAAGLSNTGSYDWTVPDAPTQAAIVKVEAIDDNLVKSSDTSALTFSIVYPELVVSLQEPVKGANVSAGGTLNITWTVSGGKQPYSAKLEYSVDGGKRYSRIDDGVSVTNYTWLVPGTTKTTGKAVIRVTVSDSQPRTKSVVSEQFTIYNSKDFFGTLQGTVHDENGDPISGATVLAMNTTYSTTSDANGTFTLLLPGGEYEIRVSMQGYEDYSEVVMVLKGAVTTLDAVLRAKHEPGGISGGDALVIGGIAAAVLAVVLGLLFFFWWRKKEDEEAMAMVCPNCGGVKHPTMPACPDCMGVTGETAQEDDGKPGAPPPNKKKCKDCGALAPLEDEWCDTCGSRLPE